MSGRAIIDLGLAVAILALAVAPALAEGAPPSQKVTVGQQYRAGGFHRAMMGSSYRALWTTPVEVEVLDFATEAGGLSVVRRVGGQQTPGLALVSRDGRAFTFRGLVKNPSNILPEELRDTFVEDMAKDQMAAQHPAGALVADEIAKAAGVPTVPIRLVAMPDDPALGEFRASFAGLVGTFAEYPTATDTLHSGFDGAVEIVDHVTLYAKIANSPDERVAVREFLRARLFDLLVSDFDRHRKQWRWARRCGDPLWHPIPEDRDQAFARYEGLLIRAAARSVPQLRTFGPEYDQILGLTFNGREQDRWLLPELPREVWREVAEEMKRQVSDETIERAARRMPPEWYAIDGTRLVAAMKKRRDALPEEADRFYLFLAGQVDVQGTNASELARVRRLENGAVEIEVARRAEDGSAEMAYFSRQFVPEETEEVRLYLRAGNDSVLVEGPRSGIKVRVIGGVGDDILDDSKGGGTCLYDFEGQNKVVEGPGTRRDERPYEAPPASTAAPWIRPRDWGRDWLTLPWTSYSSDTGLFLGAGVVTKGYGFRQDPYANRHALRAGWAFGAQQPKAAYDGEFRRANSRVWIGLTLKYSGLEVLRYYGFGNETQVTKDDEFNKVKERQAVIAPSLTLPLSGSLDCTLAPALQYAKTVAGERLIDAQQPYGYGEFGQVGGWVRLRLDTRKALRPASQSNLQMPRRGNAGAYPVSGFYLEAIAAAFPAAWDVKETYGWAEGNASTYLTAGANGRATLALRAGGKHMLGDKYPYFQAATAGGGGFFSGHDEVRGLHPNRFIGDSALYANVDLRLYISRFFLALPGEWGLLGFGDVGRVWYDDENSDTWHNSYGGGVWIGLLSRANAVAFTVAKSDERTALNIRAGFSF